MPLLNFSGVARGAGRRLQRIASIVILATAVAACGKDDREKSAEARPRLHACEYGMTIFFGLGGDSDRIRLKGWSHTEQFFTWSDGDSASLGIRLPPSKRTIRLDFRMAGFTAPPQLPFQPVDVYVNSEKLASWEVADEGIYSVAVPRQMVAAPPRLPDGRRPFILEPGTRLLVEFRLPKAISPKELGQSIDARRLGVRVSELVISNTSAESRHAATNRRGG